MGTIVKEVEIARPPADVWPLLEDVRRLPDFSPRTIEVDDAPERLTTAGQTYTQVGVIMGKRYRSRWTVRAIDPGRRIQSAGTVAPGVRYCLTQDLCAQGDHASRLRITLDYQLPGGRLGRLVERMGVATRAASEAEGVLQGIRREVERSR